MLLMNVADVAERNNLWNVIDVCEIKQRAIS
jgi:hypothetical protein